MSRVMKTAVATVAAYDVLCPHCGESIAEPSGGSFLWLANESHPPMVKCMCGEWVAVPKRVRGEKI